MKFDPSNSRDLEAGFFGVLSLWLAIWLVVIWVRGEFTSNRPREKGLWGFKYPQDRSNRQKDPIDFALQWGMLVLFTFLFIFITLVLFFCPLGILS